VPGCSQFLGTKNVSTRPGPEADAALLAVVVRSFEDTNRSAILSLVSIGHRIVGFLEHLDESREDIKTVSRFSPGNRNILEVRLDFFQGALIFRDRLEWFKVFHSFARRKGCFKRGMSDLTRAGKVPKQSIPRLARTFSENLTVALVTIDVGNKR